MILRWFLSKTVRHAIAMRKHVRNLLNAQRDILSPQAIEGMDTALAELSQALNSSTAKEALLKQMESLEKAANKWLKPYPNAAWRENVEVLLVAIAVAMGIRTFFVQPFKIPTGSMQPTLFGVTSENLVNKSDYKIPTGFARVKEWFEGISYVQVKAKNDGTLDSISRPVRFLIFNILQTVRIGGVAHTIWFPPDYGSQDLGSRAELLPGQYVHKGDDVIRLEVHAGDHLFVDRLTYNFRKPSRGEIIVFQTAGIPDPRMPQDQFYIKRLVALGGEHVQIGDDRHLIIDGKRLDSSTPHFENVYGFDPSQPPEESKFSGHLNETIANAVHRSLAPLFLTQDSVFTVDKNHYLVMGDNTMNSFDSRAWGEFPSKNVIGKSFFVYWPITKRFGWGNR